MNTVVCGNLSISIDAKQGVISSVKLKNRECCRGSLPIFVARFRDENGEKYYIDSCNAEQVQEKGNEIIYKGFGDEFSCVTVKINVEADDMICWYISVSNVPELFALEWVDFPKIRFPRLIVNDSEGGRLVIPTGEGAILEDELRRPKGFLPYNEPDYPSLGSGAFFPGMICSQFMAYIFDDVGLYFGIHDADRSLKGIDFKSDEQGVLSELRLFTGVDFGQDFATDYPIVWAVCGNTWQSAAELYRCWFEQNLPKNIKLTSKNKALPEWYKELPLIVTYPVRGEYDQDVMNPNNLFPYINALPSLEKIKAGTGAQLMALLMHWEGTAPWAPPYVWPPYGGVESFNELRDALHKNGDLMGVYCSGFSYTLESNIDEYNMEEEYQKRGVEGAVCSAINGEKRLSKICPAQRKGYDLCAASKLGKEILREAYSPLFDSGLDYVQILDQNHGGSQALCYSRKHGHPPIPGKWTTKNMQELLNGWNESAPDMLFGCESAAAEAFIGNLALSDNRFELVYLHGKPIPVYAYIYHEYVRNFMGNQVCCCFDTSVDTLRYRLAYAFSIGDLMTLILSPDGKLMNHWGTPDYEHRPDMDKTLKFINNMTRFYEKEGKKYLCCGKMSETFDFSCEDKSFVISRGRGEAVLPRLLASSWQADGGKTAYIVVNPEDTPLKFSIKGEIFEVPELNAVLIEK